MGLIEDRARLARETSGRGDWAGALLAWESITRDFPEQAVGFLGQAESLCEMGRLDKAEAILSQAMGQFPRDEYLAANYARIAARRRDWDEASQRWKTFRYRFPDHPISYVGEGEILREIGQYDQAEAAFATAVELSAAYPNYEWGLVCYAEIASRRGNWTEAIRRWQAVKSRFPTYADGWIKNAEALAQMDQSREADAVLAEAFEQHPENGRILTSYAQSAVRTGDWHEASRRWGLLMYRFPESLAGYLGKAEALTKAGQAEEAMAVLGAASDLFPDEASLPRALAVASRALLRSGGWSSPKGQKRRGEFSAYLSIFDDWEILAPALRSIDSLVDELVVVDGAYKWMAPYVQAIGRDPIRSDSRVYEAIESTGIPFRVISKIWENEAEKRVAGYEACRNRFICRVDADEIIFLDTEMLDFFFRENAAVAEMEAPLYVSPGWIVSPRDSRLPRAGFLFDSENVSGPDHLQYLWLISAGHPQRTTGRGKVFAEPVFFNAHLTHWRTPSTGVSRAAFYVLNSVREEGAPWFSDLRSRPLPNLAEVLERIPPKIFLDAMKGSAVVAGYTELKGSILAQSPIPRGEEEGFSFLFENFLRSHAKSNAELARLGRHMMGRCYLDLSSPDALAALSGNSKIALRFSSKIASANLRLQYLIPEEPWEVVRDIDALTDDDRLEFDIPDDVPGFLRRVLRLDVACNHPNPVQLFTVEL